ncbi:MAG TPA: hypothetical protein VFZ58_02840 [Candidatus Saccharimonadales bacterium]
MTRHKQSLAIDGISAAPMRTIAIRTAQGLQVKPRTATAFKSRRNREMSPRPHVRKKGSALSATAFKLTQLLSKQQLLYVVISVGSVACLIFLQIGLVAISALMVAWLVMGRSGRELFLGAFLLSLTIPVLVVSGFQQTIIAKNIATYLFGLLVAAFIILLVRKGKNYYKKL